MNLGWIISDFDLGWVSEVGVGYMKLGWITSYQWVPVAEGPCEVPRFL